MQGAGIGLLCSLTICFWIGVSSILNPVSRPKLLNSVESCAMNLSLLLNHSIQASHNHTNGLLNAKDSVTNIVNHSVPYMTSVVNSTANGTSDFVDVHLLTTFNSTAVTIAVPNLGPER